MRKNARIIQITGFRGILMAIFVASCLAAGFIAFPAVGAMYAWNFISHYIAIPTIGFLQGLMLWAIIALSVYLVNDRKKFLMSFNTGSKISDEEMQKIIDRVRMQTNAQIINSMIMKSQEFNKNTEEKNEEEKNEENV